MEVCEIGYTTGMFFVTIFYGWRMGWAMALGFPQ